MRTSFILALFLCFLKASTTLAQGLPVITQQPQSQNVCESQPFVLSVKADGAPPTYQWQKDGVDIPGANDLRYEVGGALHTQSGVYRVIVSNAFGQVSSANALVYVRRPVRVLHHPENFKGVLGSTAVFTAEFETSEPVSYQWYRGNELLKDDGRITGATSSVLTVRMIHAADTSEVFYVTATGLCGSATSDGARIFKQNVSITIQQDDVPCLDAGMSIELKATVNPILPLQFAWFFKNQKLEDGLKYQGTNTQDLTIVNSIKSDSGQYTLIASNDEVRFADTVVFTPEYNVKPDLRAIGSFHFCVDSSGISSISMRESGSFTVEMYRIDPNTYEEILVVPPTYFKGKDFVLFTVNKATFNLQGNYNLYIRNACGTYSFNKFLYIAPGTKITFQPKDTLVLVPGKTAWLNTSASGCENEDLTYQLYKNGESITGKKTVSEYEFSNPTIADTGHYFFVARGHCGVDTSKTSVVLFQEPSDISDSKNTPVLKLEQNNPNPFLKETSIRFSIPTRFRQEANN